VGTRLLDGGLTWARETGTRCIQIQVHVEGHIPGGSVARSIVQKIPYVLDNQIDGH